MRRLSTNEPKVPKRLSTDFKLFQRQTDELLGIAEEAERLEKERNKTKGIAGSNDDSDSESASGDESD